MALGVSVAVANPTITSGDSTIDLGITWTDSNGYDTTSAGTITIPTGTTTTLTSNQGIQIGSGGTNDTLTINMGNTKNATKFILDLSNVSSDKAFVGNLKVSGKNYDGGRRFQGIFGKDFAGNITLDSGGATNADNPSLIFNNGAKLEGNLIVTYEDTYITFSGKNSSDESGKITGGVTKNSSGRLTIDFDSTKGGSIGSFTATNGNSTINNLTYIYDNSGTYANDVVTIGSGTNFLNFLDNGVITGNISLKGGTTTMTNLATINGNIKASGNATLYLSNTEVGNISFDNQTGYSHTTSIFGVKSANSITTTGDWGYKITKRMKIVFADNASVKGKIWSKNEAITELVFSQATSATLKGSDDNAINMEASQTNIAYGNYSKNVLVFGANTTAKIGTMSTSGDWSGNSSIATFNLLSFNDDTASTTNVTINAINSGFGRNIIGKNLATYNSSNSSVVYNDTLFANGGYKQKTFSNPVAEFVKSTYSANGDFALGTDNTSNAISTGQGGANYISISGTTAIKGNILSSVISSGDATSGHNNLIVLTGTSAKLGEDSKAISIKVANNEGSAYNKTSNNTLLLGATTNTLILSALSAKGTYNSEMAKNFNALSINSGTTTATITSVNAGFGTNIIGKDLITQGDSSGYNTTLFGNANTPVIQSGFIAEFVKSTHSASGTFTFGDNSTSPITDAISTSQGGLNYINVSGTTTIKGNILSSTQGSTGGNNNLIVLTGTSAILGESGKAISIKVNNVGGEAHIRNSNNTLLLGATTNTLALSALSASGTYNSDARANFNALSFNNTTDNGNQTLGEISASNGSNIIGKDLITQGDSSGYNTTLFGNANTPTIQRNNISSTFMSDTHTAKGTYNITSLTIENTVMGGNYINVENLTITDGVKANSTNTLTSNERFVENYIYTNGSASIQGGISISRDSASTVDTKNVITFAGSGTNSISGNITASGGSNTIKATNLTLTNSQITANSGSNTIAISTLNSGSSISLIQATLGKNTIAIENSTSNLIIANGITTNGGWASDAQNIIELNQANVNLTISANGITTSKVGDNAWVLDHTQKNEITFSNGGILTLTTGNISAQNGNQNNITFNSTNNATITLSEANATISANTNGKNIFVFSGLKNIIASSMTKDNTGQNNLTLLTDNSTLTLQGSTNAISTLTAVSGEATDKDTLIIDTSTNANATSIDKLVNGDNLIVSMKGNATNSATLTLNNASANSTLKALNLAEATSDMDKNILNLQARTTTILDEVNIASGKGLTINLNGTSTLELDNGLSNSGNAKISFEGSNGVFDSIIDTNGSGATTTINIASDRVGVITGEIAQSNGGANNVVFNGGTAKLTLQGSSNALNSVDSTSAGTLSLNSSNASTTTIAQLKGNNLTANFGGTNQATKLVIADSDTSNKTITLAGVSLEANSTNNTLDLTSLTSATISSAVSVNPTQGLSIALGSTDMTFTQGLSGNSVLSVSGVSSFTTTSNDIQANTLNLMGNANAKATFKNTTTTLSTLNANAKGGNTLALDSSSNNVALTLANAINGVLDIELSGSATYSTTLTLNGGVIQSISATNGTSNAVIFSSGNSTINNAINSTSVASGKSLSLQVKSGVTLNAKGGIDNSSGGSINMELENNSKLYLGATSSLSSLTANNAVINIANMEVERPTRAITRNTLTIGKSNGGESYKGNAEFIIYVGGGQADNIVFNKVEKKDGVKSSATITATGSYYSIINGNHTLVATVNDTGYNSTDGSTDNMNKLQGGEVLVGGVLIKTTLIEESDSNGVVNYYLGKGVDEGAPIQYQEVASSALTVNYDLFLANFNSLNKRMGELRESEHSNGVWARVFGGNMSNDFGAGSKTDYLTAQAGYDYSLSIGESARNFMGIAVAYGTSSTQGNTLSMDNILGSSGSIALSEVDSHMIEVGLYNSYVSDSGWYNDTIFKFDYIMSKFSLSNKTDLFTDTSNFAMVLSDEFGYRYKFGESEKGSWYIDPQVEVAFGYFNQSDFNRAMYDATGTIYDTTMRATQDTILTLRTRAGASLGKKFTTDKGFASLYVGAFYEYDYINGGNASVEGQIGGTIKSLDSIESNGRAVLNVGSNIELTKGARMYIDVEKSFGDKQRTFMQFNLGARYSF